MAHAVLQASMHGLNGHGEMILILFILSMKTVLYPKVVMIINHNIPCACSCRYYFFARVKKQIMVSLIFVVKKLRDISMNGENRKN